MGNCVLVLEDDSDLLQLVREFLEEADYVVVSVTSVEELLVEAARRSPCVALIDSTDPVQFDLWHLGERLQSMGVRPLAFTAHASAREQFEQDHHGFAGVVNKPFDVEEFLDAVNSICLEEHQQAVS